MQRNTVLLVVIGSMLGIGAALTAIIFIKNKPAGAIKNIVLEKKVPLITPTPTEIPDFCITAPVLFYHHIQPFEDALDDNQKNLTVAPYNFESQIKYLIAKGYTLVPLEKIVDSLLTRTNPGKVAAIVLDDGYVNNYTYAYPIAKKLKVPINIGFVTGFASSYNQLSWGQVKTMAATDFVYIYNHSWSHQSLHGDNYETIYKQVTVAQEQLEKNLPKARRIFIYPYGRSGESVIDILEKEKFDAAFTDKKGIEHCVSQKFTLPRLRTGNFHLSVHGL